MVGVGGAVDADPLGVIRIILLLPSCPSFYFVLA